MYIYIYEHVELLSVIYLVIQVSEGKKEIVCKPLPPAIKGPGALYFFRKSRFFRTKVAVSP